MSAFFRTFVAVLAALFVFCFLLLAGLALMLESEELVPPVAHKSLLTVDLSRPIVDRPPREGLAEALDDALSGEGRPPYTLRELVTAIDRAAADERISGLFLKGQVARQGYRSGWAALRELRQAIARFRAAGKPVISWHRSLDEATLYLVAGADRIQIHPLGLVEFNGLAAEVLYLREALDRYGVGVQAVRLGEYKSAVEPFLSRKMSEENREQLAALLADQQEELIEAVARDRRRPPSALRRLMEQEALLTAEAAHRAGLVTHVGHYDQVLERLRTITDTDAGRPIERQLDAARYFNTLEPSSGDAVAVIYVEGTLVADARELQQVDGERIARLLRKARRDEEVKAVVLRINSPGGDAIAADLIQREAERLAEEKPLVVSLGTVAASGGYWIATAGREIWVQPNTITGSIGVFGLFFNLQEIAEEHGVHREVVRTAAMADFVSLLRPKTDAELARVRILVERVYRDFLAKVARARDLSLDRVEALARGRIWSGRRALALKLADRAGGLHEALASAAEKAGLGATFRVREYQRAEGLAERLLRALGVESDEGEARGPAHTLREELQRVFSALQRQGVLARLPFDLTVY